MKWYVAHVETGKEEQTCMFLKKEFSELSDMRVLVPKKTMYDKNKGNIRKKNHRLFPGYLFINTLMDMKKYYQIISTPNVYKVLSNKGDYFTPLPEYEINPLLRLLGENETIAASKVFIEESKVIVKGGPLLGLEGIIKKVNKRQKRAKILLELYNEERLVDVSIDILNVINSNQDSLDKV
ncbi:MULTISPECIES: antiterminator LoaP [Bacillus amyloliquefaciens group]|uniref:antiterminator LoaP n=1 Tax=Bacillus amyloliquefaciens group TaxID=1938374 RepID=UPI000B60B4F2|nr:MULTISPECIES: antiterminator LoaP [Bacillus amyloliquefaciens group]ASB52650.1 hypothetical protein S100072_01314 [Bacillus velezensis]MBI0442635.1 antiterminator LoaP [Bacillus velezensis]MCC9262730.1 antiterminator LoaP [Bacillus velezensis]MCM8506878.1 antiterminator LoaP [Bacillus amyloliquefaciens]MCT6683374.1 antiterminator LoaP [Bacillus velezensis]